ncbi:MAG TPA: EscU/YscU/HrcU family type III secretion system export apparatus switch protein [Treponemataceae bacterium]|nr:EscU/YscU/HrcU family type III secretion system export apparatus switch protein [Treponemataceae bacterium]
MKKTASALSYTEGTKAPLITAQGKGELAEKMIEIARQHNVPVITEAQTSELLSFYEIGEYIPEAAYEIIAKILSFVRRVENEENKK